MQITQLVTSWCMIPFQKSLLIWSTYSKHKRVGQVTNLSLLHMTTAYAVGAMSEACLLACLLDCFRPFYITLSSTSHVRHTRELSTYIGNVSGDKANSYYVQINLACLCILLRLFEVSFKRFAS